MVHGVHDAREGAHGTHMATELMADDQREPGAPETPLDDPQVDAGDHEDSR